MDCKNLDQYMNACSLSPCLKKITGQKSNSNSPTDIWFLTFKKNTHYNNTPIHKAFIKIFVSPSSLNLYTFNEKYKNIIKGLAYELTIYKDIIKPIIDYDISPNFIKYLGSGVNCTEDNLYNLLRNNTTLTNAENLHNLQRNLLYIIKGKDYRPSITVNGGIQQFETKYNPQTTYNMIVAEQINPNTTHTLSFMLDNKIIQNNPELWEIIFQCMAACYAMSLTKMTHNDLHAGNIWVEKIPKKMVTYIINDKCYQFETTYKIMIYDFDLSYVKRLGDNPQLLDTRKKRYNQRNIYEPNKDMIKVLAYFYIYGHLSINEKKNILNIIATNNKSKKYIYSILQNKNNGKFLRKDSQTAMESHNFKILETPDNIIESVGNKITNNTSLDSINLYNPHIYVCNKNMFSYNGNINVETVNVFKQTLIIKRLCKTPVIYIFKTLNSQNKKFLK